jgi:biopolymer transport protein ExbD
MKFPSRERRGGNDDHLIPLINVVFLMLIFFMVIGRIAPADLFQVRPPTSRSQQLLQEHSVTLLITHNGSLAVDAAPVTLETLIPTLQTALDAAGKKQGATPEIRIKADAALTAGQLTPVLDRLRNSGQSKVRLLTWRNG